ncbi:MAG: hypothetical protein ACKOLA_11205 [Spartobacteria bacterium]
MEQNQPRRASEFSILRPSGSAKIGDGIFDVMNNGEFLEAGTPVRVLAITGPNIVVGRAS